MLAARSHDLIGAGGPLDAISHVDFRNMSDEQLKAYIAKEARAWGIQPGSPSGQQVLRVGTRERSLWRSKVQPTSAIVSW